MNRLFQLILISTLTLTFTTSAFANRPVGPCGEPDCGKDPPDPPPPPPPPPPPALQVIAQNTGSIGNSIIGANYTAGLEDYISPDKSQFMARGFVTVTGTLLSTTHEVWKVYGDVDTGAKYGTEFTGYLLGAQLFDVKNSFQGPFSQTFTAFSYKGEIFSVTNGWSFFGTGAQLRLAIDGGINLGGSASGAALYATGTLNPRAFVDAGGTLSVSLLWFSLGSISGMIHVIDAQAYGTATIDARGLSGGHANWSLSGLADFCSLGGSISGCVVGQCETIASWGSVCPGWLALSGNASGSI